MINFDALISAYGYPALLVGAFFEGETILIAGGLLAHRGDFRLPLVILLGALGGLLSDQFYFHMGRKSGQAVLRKFPSQEKRIEKVRVLLERYPVMSVMCVRFLYGFRIVTPVAVGISGFRPVRFLLLDAVGAAVWATLFGTVGYFFGLSIENLFENIRKHEARMVLILVALATFIVIACRLTRRFVRWQAARDMD